MLRKLWKWAAILSAVVLALVLIAVVFLIVYVPGEDKDLTIHTSTSPNGRIVAEIHNVVTPMWGGPDHIEIRLRHPGETNSQVVYSRMLECNFDAFQVRWKGPEQLDVTTADCDSGAINGVPSNAIIAQKVSEWQGVRITYTNSTTTSVK